MTSESAVVTRMSTPASYPSSSRKASSTHQNANASTSQERMVNPRVGTASRGRCRAASPRTRFSAACSTCSPDTRGKRGRGDTGPPKPRHLGREERRDGEEEEQQRQNVVDALCHGGRERLDARGTGLLVEDDDTSCLAGTRGQDRVEEEPDQQCAHAGPERRPPRRLEEVPPADRPDHRPEGEG